MLNDTDTIDENQMVGLYIEENGTYRLLPLSGIVDGKLRIKTPHNSIYSGGYNPIRFADVSGWAEAYINFLSARDVINGVGENQFKPLDSITRAEFVKMMAVIAGAEPVPVDASSFLDVNPTAWYAPFVEWAYTTGLVNGVGNDRFAPEDHITRQDMAVLIARLSNQLGFVLPQIPGAETFADQNRIADYAARSVIQVQQAGIISGRPGKVFAPKEDATREESAKMLAALIRLIVSE